MLLTLPASAQNQQEIRLANDYYTRGEKELARKAFADLARKPENLTYIYSNYFSLLLDIRDYATAEDLVQKMIRREDRMTVRLDLGIVYFRSGTTDKADKYFRQYIRSLGGEAFRLKTVADYLAANSLTDYAVDALQYARDASGNRNLFILEMANLYRQQNKRELMVEEYLLYVTQSPSNVAYIKNMLQILLNRPEDMENLERLLLARVQQNPNSEVFLDLLIWAQVQQKNFQMAFIQSRAYDRRFKSERPRTLEIAQMALNHEDYGAAEKAFGFVAREYARTPIEQQAALGLLRTRDARIRTRYPVSTDSVKALVRQYEQFRVAFANSPSAHEAQLDEARLYAQYLHAVDTAASRLEHLIANPRAAALTRGRAKLELGTLFILRNEPWEATLLFAQVEKTHRDSPLGYEAKLLNARQWYFRGDFRLAQEHLDILKQATSREIANDALELSLRIKENTAFDTLGLALREFAAIELLVFQQKQEEALLRLKNFTPQQELWMTKEEAFEKNILSHQILRTEADRVLVRQPAPVSVATLLDDVYWLTAEVLTQTGRPAEALSYYEKIVQDYPQDVLGDDAYFRMAELYERQLNDHDKAQTLYVEFLSRYPGSVHVAEARKRYRQLRGDFSDTLNH